MQKPLLRILDTGLRPARWNVAMTAALADVEAMRQSRVRRDSPPPWGEAIGVGGLPTFGADGEPASCDTVRLHRYPPCVLLGAGQDLEAAADVRYCREAGIEIARRVTGGGAVYMSPGMLAWDVLVDARRHGDLAAVTLLVCGGVAAGLSRLGVAARFREPNDIEIAGRKVSGSAGYSAGSTAVLQGTVLITDDLPAMARALRLPETALRERVTYLAAEIGTAPDLQAVAECVTVALAEALACEPVHGEPSVEEAALCDRLLADEIGTEAYVAGGSDVSA